MKWMMALALAGGLAWGQSQEELIKQAQEQALKTAQERAKVHRLVTLKYVEPMAAQNLLRDFGVDMRVDRQMKVIAISGNKAAVETAEAALKQLDVPGAAEKDIDLTVYFIVGREAASANAAPVPQDLASTVAALKQTFPYKNYELLDALSLRSRAGTSASTTGQLSGSRLSFFSVNAVNVEPEGSMIRIDGLNAGIRVLTDIGQKREYVTVSGVNTQVVDAKEGQKLVVGRASEGPGAALFLVLIAKVAQ